MSGFSQTCSLQSLKQRRLVWAARAQSSSLRDTISSGYPVFDHALGGGWPNSGLIELQLAQLGVGELRLILPALTRLYKKRPLQVWVAPPARLLPHNLSAQALSRQIVVFPKDAAQQCWVMEQLLSSACCSAVIGWIERLNASQAKRLQILAREHATPVFIIRKGEADNESLPISLRLQLSANEQGLTVQVRKRQNAWPVAPFELDLSADYPQLFPRKTTCAQGLVPDNVVPFSRAMYSNEVPSNEVSSTGEPSSVTPSSPLPNQGE